MYNFFVARPAASAPPLPRGGGKQRPLLSSRDVEEKLLEATTQHQIKEDQVRLRANIREMPSTSKAYKRYVDKFDSQETQIETFQALPHLLRGDGARRLPGRWQIDWGRASAPTRQPHPPRHDYQQTTERIPVRSVLLRRPD